MTQIRVLNEQLAALMVRRGQIPAGIYQRVKRGEEIKYSISGGSTSPRVTLYYDTGRVETTPRPDRDFSPSGQQYLGGDTTFQRTTYDTSQTPTIARTGTIAGQQTMTDTRVIEGVVLETPKYPMGEAAKRLSYYRAVEKQKGYTPVGISYGETVKYDVGLAPSIYQYDPSKDVGVKIAEQRTTAQRFKNIFFPEPSEKPEQATLKKTALTTAKAVLLPTPSNIEKAYTQLSSYEEQKITPLFSKGLRIEELKRIRSKSISEYERTKDIPTGSKWIVSGGRAKFEKDVLGIGVGLRTFLSKPVTEVAPEIALGIATGGTFKGAGLVLERLPLRTSKFLASPIGVALRKVANRGIGATFIASETYSISKSSDPFVEIGKLPFKLGAFIGGERIGSKPFEVTAVRRKVGTSYAELERQEALLKTTSKEGKEFFDPYIELHRKISGLERSKKVSIGNVELTPKTLPQVIPKEARIDVITSVKELDLLVFGSESVKLKYPKKFEKYRSYYAGKESPVGDLDTALKSAKIEYAGEKLAEDIGAGRNLDIKPQSIGIKGGKKFFDIKPQERLEGFAFISPIKSTKAGVRTTSISEELGRKISGGIEYRKEGKDIPDIKAIGRLLVEDPRISSKLSPELKAKVLKSVETPVKAKDFFRSNVIEASDTRGLLSRSSDFSSSFRKSSRILPSSFKSASKLPSSSFGIPSKIPSSVKPSSIKPSSIPKSSIIPSSIKPSKPSYIPSKTQISKAPTSTISELKAPSKAPSSVIKSVLSSRIPSSPSESQLYNFDKTTTTKRVLRFTGGDELPKFRELPITPIRQPKVLTPTGRASLFALKGRTTKAGVKTGLGARFINVPKTKRKKIVRSRIKL